MLESGSTSRLWRMGGAPGGSCQCITAWPGAVAQKAIWATRKSGPKYVMFMLFPDANAPQPGSLTRPLKTHCPGPLHTSFWKVESNTVLSRVTVLVSTQPAEEALTFCSRFGVKM